MRRSESLRFMGGWHAFPGGRLSRSDVNMPTSGEPEGREAYASSGTPGALPACALRELFEETGILPVTGGLPDASATEAARRELLAESLDFAGWLRSRGLAFDVSRLAFAGRWVTPPLSPIRFDATFFLLEWPPGEPLQPSVIPGELASGEWIAAHRALRRWEAGEVYLAQPTLETVRTLAADGPAGRARLSRSEAHDPDGPRPIEFRPGIRVIPLKTRTLPPATHTNAVLLGTGDFVLVDPGTDSPGGLRALYGILDRELGSAAGRLRGIWLTHHHPDHVAGAEAARRQLGVPTWAHESTAAHLAGSGIRVERRFSGGELVTLAGTRELRIRVLHTPGHASGHLCFFEEGSRTLLCGDMLTAFGSVVINPPDGNMSDYLASLRILEAVGAEVILPSHGTMLRDARKAIREAITHRLRREDLVLRAWKNDVREPEAMLGSVYPELHPAARPLAARQVLAHLERLAALGRIGQLPSLLAARLGESL